MTFPFGLLIALSCIIASILHLQQAATNYFDLVAFLMVLGGTTAVAVITFPWQNKIELKNGIKQLFFKGSLTHRKVIAAALDFVRMGGSTSSTLSGLAGEVLRDGAELISLGFPREKIEQILEERIYQQSERTQEVANAFRGLSKYPPAFGLVGTVLGLVSLMRSISAGLDSKQTGLLMAVALVATLYGLLVSNLVINPAGENILKLAIEDRKRAEIALKAVSLACEGVSLLEAQEVLNSFVQPHERVNILNTQASADSESGAAEPTENAA